MKCLKLAFATIYVLTMINSSLAQQNNDSIPIEGTLTYETNKPFRLLDIEKKDEYRKRKKKRKRKVFYGIKTKKGVIKTVRRNQIIWEKFYYLKVPEKSDIFADYVYWYDFLRKKIRRTKSYNSENGALLHGLYKKTTDKKIVLEEGIFYKGVKHGRWMKYDKNSTLIDKQKYYKGWPKESTIAYYDPLTKKKIKEVMSIAYQERNGDYYLFYENGSTAVKGKYQWNCKIGDWTENYPSGQRKRIISYSKKPFDKKHKPFIRKEWNEKGKEIYSYKPRQ